MITKKKGKRLAKNNVINVIKMFFIFSPLLGIE